jgi:hypothetical protein
MARRNKWIAAAFVPIIAGLVVFQSVKHSNQSQLTIQREAFDPNAFYVFGEGDLSRRVYIFHGNQVIVQSSRNPGFGKVMDRQWYYPKEIPDSAVKAMKQWVERPSNGSASPSSEVCWSNRLLLRLLLAGMPFRTK